MQYASIGIGIRLESERVMRFQCRAWHSANTQKAKRIAMHTGALMPTLTLERKSVGMV